MNILILKKFNNYANRIVVRYETLLNYQERASSFLTFENINFNPNDGVMTELVVGSETQQQPGVTPGTTVVLDWDTKGAPDYLVCYENNSIVSRWFITECVRTRLGQFKLTLKRDSIADLLDSVEEATCFIEKGRINDTNDSAIYNKEEITTNQIKSDEFLIKDETQSGWIVGYVAKDRESSGTLTPTSFTEQTIPGPEATDSAADEVYANESEFWAAHQDLMAELASLNNWTATVQLDVFYGRLLSHYKVGQTIHYLNNGSVTFEESAYNNDLYLHSTEQDGYLKRDWKWWTGDWRETFSNNFIAGWKTDSFRNSILDQIESKENVTISNESLLQNFFNYIKREPVIKIGSKFYKPFDKYGGDGAKSTITESSFITPGSLAYELFYNGLDLTPEGEGEGSNDLIVGTPGPETFKVEYSINKHALGLREIFSQCKAKIPASVPVLKDAPYHMFAIPYADDLALYQGNTLHCVTNKSVAMNAAQALAQQAGAGVVYDVQLLPYCPVRDIIKTTKVTEHYEIAPASFDTIIIKIGWLPGSDIYGEQNIMKVNHRYLIAKDLVPSSNSRLAGIRSNSVIKVSVGDPADPLLQTTYEAKRIEVGYRDINDTSSTYMVRIYDTLEDTLQKPLLSMTYDEYVASSNYIMIETTDVCEYVALVHNILTGEYTKTYVQLISGERQQYPSDFESMFKDWFFYEDYYLTKLDISNVITSDIVTMVGGNEGDIVNTIFWCTDSQFSFNKFLDNYFLLQSDGTYKKDTITELINEKVKRGSDVVDIKVKNQVDMLRLASPNYSNFFDINIQRNNGIEYINVDCTYKPYQPYIHLNPNFKGLYGADYNDVRGLICGGDYSIALTSDAWATYQLQNKNYQAVFDRQIQQLEVAQSIQQQNEIMNVVSGVGIGAVGGALTGAKFGGGYGAIAGAIVGAGASTIGGLADISNNQRLRELQISTMKDIHGYQLDNIKALPLGLSKTSYLTNNNKLFPFLEFYTCTPIEEMAVRSKIDYNGMTINRIGKIRDFENANNLSYIKAKLIRINIDDDPHQVIEISNELASGIYLSESGSDIEGE